MTDVTELTHHPLRAELAAALDLAIRAGALALDIQRRGATAMELRHKDEGGGPVTRADLEADALIVHGLAALFPGDAILAEESHARDGSGERERLERPRCWMVDPVDGTRDFAGGAPSWAVHVGLCIGGEPALGVVHEPAEGRVSFGLPPREGHAGGAWRRDVATGVTSAVSVVPAPEVGMRLVTSRSHRTPISDRIAHQLDVAPHDDLRLGSTGVKLARVARGDADVYVHPSAGTRLWDTCAPQALLHAAGGLLTDLFGDVLRFDTAAIDHPRGLLAAHPARHAELVERLAPLARAALEG